MPLETQKGYPAVHRANSYKTLPLLVLAVVTVVKLKCPYCGYVWDYKGKHRGYATCPSCLKKVDIEQNRVE